MSDDYVIRVMRFRDAPLVLRELSPHGGDEDWLAVVPGGMDVPGWLEGPSFGVCDVSQCELPDGSTVVIGAHS